MRDDMRVLFLLVRTRVDAGNHGFVSTCVHILAMGKTCNHNHLTCHPRTAGPLMSGPGPVVIEDSSHSASGLSPLSPQMG